MTDITLEIGGNRVTWQLPEGGWARIDLAGVGSGASVRFYGEDAGRRVITGSTPPSGPVEETHRRTPARRAVDGSTEGASE